MHDGWSPVTMQREAAQPGGAPVQPRPQTGLLAGWKADNTDFSLSVFDAPTAQIAVAPIVTRERTTDPNYRPTPQQDFVPGQVSPAESAARSLAPTWTGSSVQNSPSSQPLAPFNAQPFPKPPIWSY